MTPTELRNYLLEKRGYDTPEKQEAFLFPKYEDMHDPFLMHDMEKSVLRIIDAINNNEKICIYSDYDADGIPGAVILHDFFKKINYENFFNYIPHRHHEGYGLHRDALEKIHAQGATLVITVDLGITAVAEVEFARELGLEVIITDHHEPLEVIPNAFAIVNPKLGDYPDPMLCGAGTAFKLIQALLVRLPLLQGRFPFRSEIGPSEVRVEGWGEVPHGWEKWLLDMAGLATLSDMVPLVNENRIIAYYGMKVLKKNQRPGLRALFSQAGISMEHLTEDDVVFSITPRINAAGRMAHPEDAFQALAIRDPKQSLIAAQHLAGLNDTRKKIVATIMKEVHKKVSLRKQDQELPNILVIGDPAWPAGILGLVASKITETYKVTTFVWGSGASDEEITDSGKDHLKGSCRGVGDISIVKIMEQLTDTFIQFGGHEDAGGFTITRERVHFLEQSLNDVYHTTKHELSKQVHETSFDTELHLSDVTKDHYNALRELAPFGVGNPKPVFKFENIKVISVKQFGKTKEHLEVVFQSVRAISWYATPSSFTREIIAGETITLLAEFDYSVFRGKEELRLKIIDIL